MLSHASRPVQGYEEWWKVGKRYDLALTDFSPFAIDVGLLWQQFNGMLNNFERFRGTIEVDFKVIAQSFDFGCGYLGWEPETMLLSEVSNSQWTTLSHTEGIMVDLRSHNHVKLKIPWSGPTKYKGTDLTGLGTLFFKPVVPIQSQSATPKVEYVMFVRILDIDQNIPKAQSGGQGKRSVSYGFKTDTSINSFDPATVGVKSLYTRPTGHSVVDLDKDPSGSFQIVPGNSSRVERLLGYSSDWNYTLRVYAMAVKTEFHKGVVTFYRTRSNLGNTNRAGEKIIWDLSEKDSICFDVHFNPDNVMSGGTNNIFVYAAEGLVFPDTVQPGVRIVFAVSMPELYVSGLAQCWDWKSTPEEGMALGHRYIPQEGKKTFEEVVDGEFQLVTLNTQSGSNHLTMYNSLDSVSSAPARILKLFARHASSFKFEIVPTTGILTAALSGFGSDLPCRFDQMCETNVDNVGSSASSTIAVITDLPPVGVNNDGAAMALMLNQGENSTLEFYPSGALYSPAVKEPNRAASITFNAGVRPASFSLSLKVDPNSFYALTSRNLV